jgi:hypothetical protein
LAALPFRSRNKSNDVIDKGRLEALLDNAWRIEALDDK